MSSSTNHSPVPSVPPFRSRPTLAAQVQANMKLAARTSHWHRIAVIAGNGPSQTPDNIKELLEKILSKVNRNAKFSDRLSGFVALYAAHTVIVLTGNERSFGAFAEEMGKCLATAFVASRVVLFQTNVNHVSNYYIRTYILLTILFLN